MSSPARLSTWPRTSTGQEGLYRHSEHPTWSSHTRTFVIRPPTLAHGTGRRPRRCRPTPSQVRVGQTEVRVTRSLGDQQWSTGASQGYRCGSRVVKVLLDAADNRQKVLHICP